MAQPSEGFFHIDVPPSSVELKKLVSALAGTPVADSPGAIDSSSQPRRTKAVEFDRLTRKNRAK